MFCIYCGQKVREEEVYCQNPSCKRILPWRSGMPVPPPVQTEESTASDVSDKVIPIRPKAEAAAKSEAAVTVEPGAQQAAAGKEKKKGGSKKKKVIAVIVSVAAVELYSNYHSSHNSAANLVNRRTATNDTEDTTGYDNEDDFDTADNLTGGSESEGEMLTISADALTMDASQQTMELYAEGTVVEEDTGVWYSENQDIAQVSVIMDDSTTDSVRARVTAVASGETVIHFTSGGYETSCRVTCDFSDIHDYEYIPAESGCTWQNAYDNCLARGGHLLTINSDEEYSHIKAMLEDGGNQNKVIYLGGLRQYETSYYWDVGGTIEGENLNDSISWAYSCWMNGEPSFQDGDVEERYMSMFYYSGENRWVWNDSPEDLTTYFPDKVGYICEYE